MRFSTIMVWVVVVIFSLFLTRCNPAENGAENIISQDSATVIINYMNYRYQVETEEPLTIIQNNKIIYTFDEGDYDTIKLAYEWTYFRWSQGKEKEEEVFPKNWRTYRIYGTTFYKEDD